MNLRKFIKKSIDIYQIYISPMLGNNCRYYPSCSEYTKIEFEQDKIYRAFYKSFVRFLTCNQLFPGGIDFPVVKKEIKLDFYIKKPEIKYWFIPTDKDKYIVIKAEHGQ